MEISCISFAVVEYLIVRWYVGTYLSVREEMMICDGG